MKYPSYLIHFNKNHSKKNGQFISGDGDGDGIPNDHAARKKEDITTVKKVGNGYKQTMTTIEKKSGNTKIVDDLVDNVQTYGKMSYVDGDYTKADGLFDRIGAKAASIYQDTKDLNKAVKYLVDNMSDVPYKAKLLNTLDENEGYEYVTFYLEAYGDKYLYGTAGEPDYSDEQYFDVRNKQ